jgi:NAD(P)-dependent dehydrogenase (short-subunit alcohol dehydrogenase family)
VAALRPDATCLAVDLPAAASREPGLLGRLLTDVATAAAAGSLRPLPVTTFPATGVIDAFRHMQQARHIGKIAVVHGRVPAVRADATYLITGGLGGVGLSTARWLVAHGARSVVLVGRRAPSDDACVRLGELEAAGARVTTVQADVSCAADVARLFGDVLPALPPLRGVFHGALVLDDGAIVQQSWERFRTVLGPRATGAWLLHAWTAALPLDFFVLYSAAGAVLGSPGQASYTAANTFLDALAQHRRSRGLAGLSVQWGVWSDTGRAAALGVSDRARLQGIGSMTADQAHAALDVVLRQVFAPAAVAVVQVDWPAFLGDGGPRAAAPFFADMLPEARPPAAAAPAPPAGTPRRLRQELDRATPARRALLLAAHVRAQVTRVLGLEPGYRIGADQPLQELGLDSLMAVELRTLLGTGLELPAPLPATLAFDYPSVVALVTYLSRTLFGDAAAGDAAPSESTAAAARGATAATALVAELSEREAEALLLAELDALPPGARS